MCLVFREVGIEPDITLITFLDFTYRYIILKYLKTGQKGGYFGAFQAMDRFQPAASSSKCLLSAMGRKCLQLNSYSYIFGWFYLMLAHGQNMQNVSSGRYHLGPIKITQKGMHSSKYSRTLHQLKCPQIWEKEVLGKSPE